LRCTITEGNGHRERAVSRKSRERWIRPGGRIGRQGRVRNLVQPLSLSRSAVPSSPIATLASVRSRVRTNAGNGPSRGPRPRSSARPSLPHVPAQLPEHGDSIVAVNDQVKGLAGCPYNHHSGGSVSAVRLLVGKSARLTFLRATDEIEVDLVALETDGRLPNSPDSAA
jgi:hypothetical protein